MSDAPIEPSGNPADTYRVILANELGDARGLNVGTDTGSIAVTAYRGGTAQSIRYGVAYAPNRNGVAHAGALGVGVTHHGRESNAGDGGVAYAWSGRANCGLWGTAYNREGVAFSADYGVAVALLKGEALCGAAGLACHLSFRSENNRMVTDPSVGIVQGGPQSVVVAFSIDGPGGQRRPVVGILGSPPEGLSREVLDILEAGGVQFGLRPGVNYRLNSTGRFVEVAAAPELEGAES